MEDNVVTLKEIESQKNEIYKLLHKSLEKGEHWFLVDCKWFKQWKRYVGYDTWETNGIGENSSHPGPIDNSPLLEPAESENEVVELREHLIDELDYILIPEEAWLLLVEWYGITEGQEAIKRKVVEHGLFVKHCKVEVYLLSFKLCENNALETFETWKFSKADCIEDIEKKMRSVFHIPDNIPTRLWNRYACNTFEQLSKLDNSIQDAGLFPGQTLIIERQNADGSWPRQAKSTGSVLYNGVNNASASESKPTLNLPGTAIALPAPSGSSERNNSSNNQGTTTSYEKQQYQPGLCGLSNLGNTCFMNSVLQCMSNCPPTTMYFLENRHLRELNENNPLGMHGQIATSFAELVQTMWSGNHSYTAPRNFKMQVGRFAPQFSGYQQHDSQELLTFLLDGLHEDLNRIIKKPYIEQRDTDGRAEQIVADETWNNYRKRNNSVIVDVFHALLKSTLECPECKKVSITFDPFCYLSLPLPQYKEKPMVVSYISADPQTRPLRIKVMAPKQGIVDDLCTAVGKLMKVPSKDLFVSTVYRHRLTNYMHDDRLTKLQDSDNVCVYEVLRAEEDDPVLLVYFKCKHADSTTLGHSSDSLFADPLLISVPKSTSYKELYDILLHHMQRYINDQNDGEYSPVEDSNTRMEEDDNENDDPLEKNLFKITFQSKEEDKCIPDDENAPINFPCRNRIICIAVNWLEDKRKEFFNEDECNEVDEHETVSTVRNNTRKANIQLTDCIELYTHNEQLGVDDAWYCPTCKKRKQAMKKFDLWTLPEILIIQLKRFSFNRHWRDKIDAMVDYPTKGLDMAPYVKNPVKPTATVYDLIGVCNHYGGLGGGHYTAFAKNREDGKWYQFDDSTVTSIDEQTVNSRAAYVLFYMRRENGKEYSTSNYETNHTMTHNGLDAEADEEMETN